MEKRTQQVFLATLAGKRISHCLSQCVNIIRNKVGQVHVFAVIPNLFDRVKIRSIGRQPFEVQSAEPQFEFPCRRTVNHPAIHNQDEAPGKMSQYLRNKLLKVVSVHIRVLYRKIESELVSPRRNTYRRNGRQSVATVPSIMDWSLAFRRPSAANSWLKHKTAFVHKYDGFAASTGFFLSFASLPFARLQLPFHRVLLLDVRAFGNSSPWLSEYARHWTTRTGCQNAFQSLRPLSEESIVQWHNRYDEHPLAGASQADASAYPTGCCVDLEGCEPQRNVRRTDCKPSASPIRSMGLPRSAVRSLEQPVPVSAMRWLCAAVAPTVPLFLRVSYP